MPIIIDDMGPTKPVAGVIATSPATAPIAAPRTVGLRLVTHSANTQTRTAAADAVLVATKALPANPPAASAILPLVNEAMKFSKIDGDELVNKVIEKVPALKEIIRLRNKEETNP